MVEQHHPSLKPYNTFGIEASADRLLVIEHPDEAALLADVPNLLVIGKGSNVVPTADYHGTVAIVGCRAVLTDGHCIEAEAGMVWDDLVAYSLQQGLYGMENLSAIPGTVGASVVQNIGAYGAEVKDIVEWVEAYDLALRQKVRLSAQQCGFGYRQSVFKQQAARYVVLRVRYNLRPHFIPQLNYAALQGLPHSTATQLREAITSLRWSKLPKPEEYGSAGSFFKNPVVPHEVGERLQTQYPNMPLHPAAEGMVKLSAAWLIDQSGWKGRTLGKAGVWPHQALVLYNTGGCTGSEVLQLSEAIQRDVQAKFGVYLEPEAVLI